MTQAYWNKKHTGNFDGDWSNKPSIFAEYAVEFFPKEGKILEIGTGKGGDAGFFHSRGYEVVATDFSEEAIKFARKNFKGVEFIRLDTAQGLPFENNSFDVVYSHMSLHYFDAQTTRKIFEDIHRVLKPNGIFATITNTIDDTEQEANDFEKLEEGFYKNTSKNISKRYFSTKSMEGFASGLFKTILLDSKGEVAYKERIKTLVRFVGKKAGKLLLKTGVPVQSLVRRREKVKVRKHANILISGAVQGVFFRAHAKRVAGELGLAGYVQNLPDGSVYLEAEGEPKALEKLVKWCKEGPDSAEVSRVEIKEDKAVNFADFKIKY